MGRFEMMAGLGAALLMLDPLPAHAGSATVARPGSGAVSGMTEGGVRVFRGVPYATPPLGSLRWRAPQPIAKWKGVKDATKFAPSCLQAEPKPFGPYTAAFITGPERSEDCLYLNVWSPALKGKRPVYVFIHGGGFQGGGTDIAAYDGTDLARHGAVVVTINYRLGHFGFFAHPELSKESPLGTSGNQGILDAIEALRWVRANIAQFGGDPTRVTIAGQSAGAGIVGSLLVSPLAKGLFHRAVLESGPVLGLPALPLARAETLGVATGAKLKAPGLEALRALPAEAFAAAGLPGLPLPIVDGKVLPGGPEDPATPIVSPVPVIAGYNRDESPDVAQTVAAFEKDVRGRFGKLADRVLALYPHRSDEEAARSARRLARDGRVAGLLTWAQGRQAAGQPVYLYHFEHTYPGKESLRYGAFHTAEVPYFFGALDLDEANFSAADARVSAEIQDRLLAFLKTGTPRTRTIRWTEASLDPGSIWRIDPADTDPLLTPERLEVFQEYLAAGGKLGLL